MVPGVAYSNGENFFKIFSYFSDKFFVGQPIGTKLFVDRLDIMELLLDGSFFTLTTYVKSPGQPNTTSVNNGSEHFRLSVKIDIGCRIKELPV